MNKLIIRILLTSLVGMMVLGLTAVQAGTIKVGITFNMVSETGQKMGQMVMAEFAKQNELGGINGHQLKPILLRSDCKTDKGVANVSRFVHQDKVHLIIGATCSGVTIASMEVSRKAGVPQITPHSTNQTVTMKGNPWIFRSSISGRFGATALPYWTSKNVGTNITYVYGSDAGAQGFMKRYKGYLKKHYGVDPAGSFMVPEDAIDVRAQMLKAKATDADAILIAGLPAVGGRWFRQAKEVGIKVPLFSGDGISNVMVPKAAGDAIVGAWFNAAYSGYDNRPIARLFNAMTKEKYGVPFPGQDLAQAWDVSQIVFAALRRAKLTLTDASLADDRTAIRDALASTRNYMGLSSGPISFCKDPSPQCRDGARTPVMVRYTKGGENFELELFDRPTMDIDTGL